MLTRASIGALAIAFYAGLSGAALADSCWDHNGSIMRLKANGSSRAFYYEHPKPDLAPAGVRRGTLLFDGRISGNRYEGTARVYSKYCPADPLEYWVEGSVTNNQTRVTVTGTREVYDKCDGTGRFTTDRLVFNYKYDC